jgi:hypothetical protein
MIHDESGFHPSERDSIMTFRGTVRNGVVVMHSEVALPEGAEVVVVLPESEPPKATSGVWAKLANLGRWAETQASNLPIELAENHDHYLHGQPKR